MHQTLNAEDSDPPGVTPPPMPAPGFPPSPGPLAPDPLPKESPPSRPHERPLRDPSHPPEGPPPIPAERDLRRAGLRDHALRQPARLRQAARADRRGGTPGRHAGRRGERRPYLSELAEDAIIAKAM